MAAEQGLEIAASILHDQKSLENMFERVDSSAQVEQGVSMKDPTVQKTLRFTQSLLEVLAEKSAK